MKNKANYLGHTTVKNLFLHTDKNEILKMKNKSMNHEYINNIKKSKEILYEKNIFLGKLSVLLD